MPAYHSATDPPGHSSTAADDGTPTARRAVCVRLGGLTVALVALYALLAWAGPEISMERIREWGDGLGIAGPALFVGLGVALNTVFVPFPIIAGAAGLVFGIATGTAVAIVISPLVACAQMLIARHVIRDRTSVLLGDRGVAINEFLERRGFVAVLTTHLVPGLPYGPLNFATGLTRLRVRDMAAGTAVAKAPRAFAYAALGGSLSNLRAPEAVIAVSLLVLLAIVGFFALSRQLRAERAHARTRRSAVDPSSRS